MNTPIRFQVNKRVEAALKNHHPWIFRNQCSSALDAIPVGSLVKIYGTKNNFLGLGIFEPLSAVAIRVFSFQDFEPSPTFFLNKLRRAHEKRLPHIVECNTNAYRLLHGEADGFPGVTLDVYDKTGVVVFYLKSWRPFIENPLKNFAEEIGLKKLYVKTAHGNQDEPQLENLLSGEKESVPEPVWFLEDGLVFPAYPVSGLKTGFFLDLREVRLVLPHLIKKGQTVLNLFAADGVFSAQALKAGASQVVSVERHDAGRAHFEALCKRWKIPFESRDWIEGDAWEYLEKTSPDKKFDVVIVDPPSLASKKDQLPTLKGTWSRLHTAALSQLAPDGILISISCTERLLAQDQIEWTKSAAKSMGLQLKLLKVLPPNFDHPEMKNLPERNYFHAVAWKNA